VTKSLIKVAIIGCGRISGHHCQSIVLAPNLELVAVCDLLIDRANNFRNQFGVKSYDNYHTMLLENKDIDTVVIATPSGMHYEHAMDIIRRYGKNIVVEKPTFMRPSQVREVYSVAESVGVRIFAVFQNRHNRAVQRVLSGLNSGELGSLRLAAVRVRWCRQQRYYDLAPWRGTFSMDGGCLTNQGIHHIDLLRQFGGDILRVSSNHKTLGADIEVEDTAIANIEFLNGALGTLEITTAARPIDYEASLSLVCENGIAQIGGIAVNQLQIYTPDPDACVINSEDFSGNVYGHGHEKIYEQISESLQHNKEYPIGLDDVFKTIQLLNAFYISNETQSWVDIAASGDSLQLGRLDKSLAELYRIQPI